MNELCLFAGIGGGPLATKWMLGFRTVCYVEWDQYCIGVLTARIRDGLLDDAPIWDDARTFDGRPWRGKVDIATAGFPCQPFSAAGKQMADADERNLWPDTIRIIRETRPEWVMLENVPGLLSGKHGYFGVVLGNLAEAGYDARWQVLSAEDIGANHKRERLWVVAHTDEVGRDGRAAWAQGRWDESKNRRTEVPDAESARLEGPDAARDACSHGRPVQYPWRDWWAVEPGILRVVDGVPRRMDRLKGIGNGQVPPVVAVVWELLTGESNNL